MDIRNKWIKLLMILAGNTIYALGIAVFVIPNGLITGGTTGLSLVANYALHISMSTFVAVFNVAMFFVGVICLGRAFALTTIISTFYYPCIFRVFEIVFKDVKLTDDLMLATVCAGGLIGVGIAIVIRAGASTGGMDIPPLVLQKKIGLPVSVGLYAFDTFILLGQMLFSNKEQILYGILLVVVYTTILDKILVIGTNQVQVKIISEKFEELNEAIHTKMDRGTTFFEVEGGYLRQKSYALITVLSSRELPKLNDLVMQIDPKAFIVIHQVHEVRGRGFTQEKVYLDK